MKNFEAVRYYSGRYFRGFFFCEILNMVVLALVFQFTNAFLGHEFSSYGSDVLRYYGKDLVNDFRFKRSIFSKTCDFFAGYPKNINQSYV